MCAPFASLNFLFENLCFGGGKVFPRLSVSVAQDPDVVEESTSHFFSNQPDESMLLSTEQVLEGRALQARDNKKATEALVSFSFAVIFEF